MYKEICLVALVYIGKYVWQPLYILGIYPASQIPQKPVSIERRLRSGKIKYKWNQPYLSLNGETGQTWYDELSRPLSVSVMFTIVFRRFPGIEEFEEICEQISTAEEIQYNDDKEIIDSTIELFTNFC